MATKQAPVEFIRKIKTRMNEQNLGVSELARRIGVSHPTVIDLVTYGKKPSFNTCIALSTWLNQSPVLTLQEAGLLPPETIDDKFVEQADHIIQNYKYKETKQKAIEFLEYLVTQESHGENNAAPLSKKTPKPNNT